MAAHRYWRVRSPSTWWTDGTTFSLAELKLKDSYGGPDRAHGLTGEADSSFSAGFLPANAFDGNPATIWNSSTTPLAGGHWIGVDFGVGVTYDIVEIEITARNDPARQEPKSFFVEWSDDNLSWTTSWSVSGLASWDAGNTLIFNNKPTAIHTTQAFVLTAINFPSPEERTTQAFTLVAAQPTIPMRTTQAFILVAIKTGAEERALRAWTFTQDDHDFYVLQLAGSQTYIFDKSTGQWCQWLSPDAAYWRGQDGCDWQGINVCCDPDTGDIHQIDPNNRLDNNTTPIQSIVYSNVTVRMSRFVPVFMAEVAISEGRPPAGIDASTVGLKLRTSDTLGWTDHGTVAGLPTGQMTYARWFGLGLAKSPGFLMEITDTGYARRIDGLTVEFGPANG